MALAEVLYRDSHTSDGRCKYPRSCVIDGVHVQPEPLTGDRHAPDGRKFAWGPIDAIHRIGEYAVVEYRQDRSNHSPSQPWCWDDHNETRFHPYINGRDTNCSYLSLDSALIGVIAYKREGPNGQAAAYFNRMTNVEN